jgi:hypothetical protein
MHTNGNIILMPSFFKQPQEKPLRSKRGHRSKVTPPPSTSANAGPNISPSAGPSQSSAYLPQPPDSVEPDAAANTRINQQFYNTYPQPPQTAPQGVANVQQTNGTPTLPPLASALPPVAAPSPRQGYSYDPTQDERRENGNGEGAAGHNLPTLAAATGLPVSAAATGEPSIAAPPDGQNGQAPPAGIDTEMGEAGDAAGGFGGGFTAVNR